MGPATFFLKEILIGGHADLDGATRAFDQLDGAQAAKQRLDDQDRANGFYRPGRWTIVQVS